MIAGSGRFSSCHTLRETTNMARTAVLWNVETHDGNCKCCGCRRMASACKLLTESNSGNYTTHGCRLIGINIHAIEKRRLGQTRSPQSLACTAHWVVSSSSMDWLGFTKLMLSGNPPLGCRCRCIGLAIQQQMLESFLVTIDFMHPCAHAGLREQGTIPA